MQQIKKINDFFNTHPLTKSQQLRAWSRFIAWQIRSRLQEKVIIDWVGGQRLCVKRGMTGATGNIYAGLHEFVDMAFLLHFLKKDDLFIDVGANVGSYTILAAGVCKSNVWAFEPDPQTYEHLRQNIKINSLDEKVKTLKFALGEFDGNANFTIGLDTINHVTASNKENTRLVEIRKLDSLIGQLEPIMMKIDVEGHEPSMIRGAKAALEKSSLMVIEIETLTEEISTLLDKYGFVKVNYNPFRRELSNSESRFESANFLFVRNIDLVSSRLQNAPSIDVLNITL